MIIFVDGKFLKEKEAKISVLDHGFLYGNGVFTTFRTYSGKPFCLKEHLKRLFESAAIIDLKVPWTKKQIAKWTIETYKKNKKEFGDARVRINISRGVCSDVPIDYSDSGKSSISIIVSKLPKHEAKFYKEGVSLLTVNLERVSPKSKNFSFYPSIAALKEARKRKFWDALFVDEKGNITESSTGNIFIVKNKSLITPPDKILEGITRLKVIELAKKNKIKVSERHFKIKELINSDEAFVTGTTKEIVPVAKVNNSKIKGEVPGEITQKLMQEFRVLTQQ